MWSAAFKKAIEACYGLLQPFYRQSLKRFGRYPFSFCEKKKWQLLSVLPTFEKNVVILLAPFKLALLENMAIANLAKSFCTDLGSLIRNARTQCGIFRDFVWNQFWSFWSPKTAILTILAALNFEFFGFFDIFKYWIPKNDNWKPPTLLKIGVFIFY